MKKYVALSIIISCLLTQKIIINSEKENCNLTTFDSDLTNSLKDLFKSRSKLFEDMDKTKFGSQSFYGASTKKNLLETGKRFSSCPTIKTPPHQKKRDDIPLYSSHQMGEKKIFHMLRTDKKTGKSVGAISCIADSKKIKIKTFYTKTKETLTSQALKTVFPTESTRKPNERDKELATLLADFAKKWLNKQKQKIKKSILPTPPEKKFPYNPLMQKLKESGISYLNVDENEDSISEDDSIYDSKDLNFIRVWQTKKRKEGKKEDSDSSDASSCDFGDEWEIIQD